MAEASRKQDRRSTNPLVTRILYRGKCEICKNRRIVCDNTRPICNTCSKGQLDRAYPQIPSWIVYTPKGFVSQRKIASSKRHDNDPGSSLSHDKQVVKKKDQRGPPKADHVALLRQGLQHLTQPTYEQSGLCNPTERHPNDPEISTPQSTGSTAAIVAADAYQRSFSTSADGPKDEVDRTRSLPFLPRQEVPSRVEDTAVTFMLSKLKDMPHVAVPTVRIIFKYYPCLAPSSPLRHMLEAMALTVLEFHKSYDLRRVSEAHYSTALRLAQVLLEEPKASRSNELLLTVFAMCCYATMNNDLHPVSVFKCHLRGWRTLLRLRRLREIELDRDFADIHYNSMNMLVAAGMSDAVPLPRFHEGESWITWQIDLDNPLESLTSVGAEIAEIRARAKSRPGKNLQWIEDTLAMDQILDHWLESRSPSRTPNDQPAPFSPQLHLPCSSSAGSRSMDRGDADCMSFYYFIRLQIHSLIYCWSSMTGEADVLNHDLATFNVRSQLKSRSYVDELCAHLVNLQCTESIEPTGWTYLALAFATNLDIVPVHQKRWIRSCLTAGVDHVHRQRARLRFFEGYRAICGTPYVK